MKNRLFFIAMLFCTVFADAQQIPRKVIAEHFTNTYCSICAARNPGLFSNLNSFPQVIHLAYYPSAPYMACPLSMANPTENDARTNYYGVYGATPVLIIGGTVINTPFTDPAIFSTQLPLTTSFALNTSIAKSGSDSIAVKIVIKKVDTSSLSSLQLFACVVEDTLSFLAHNGETANYDVFRKAFWGLSSLSVTAPVAVGDSSVYSKKIAINSAWNLARIYSVAILQRTDKIIVQASKSAHLQVPSEVANVNYKATFEVYPNPASDKLYIDQHTPVTGALIIDSKGSVIMHIGRVTANSIDISTLVKGAYFLIVDNEGETKSARFIKI